MKQRLQKLISQAGLASRRKAEKWIEDGLVSVNGQQAQLGDQADLTVDDVIVRGQTLKRAEEKVTVLLNKPRGYVSTLSDPQGRRTVVDLVDKLPQRFFPVGRLDYNTEGLLLLTNDGELSQLLTHPKHHVEKTYLVKVRGHFSDAQKQAFEKGVALADGMTAPARVDRVRFSGSFSWFELTIREGKNRQIRRMCEHVDLTVVRLKRIRLDFLTLGELKSRDFRFLTVNEIKKLKNIT